MDLYQKIDLTPSVSGGFDLLLNELIRYPLAEIHLFLHVSHMQYQVCPPLGKLNFWERRKALAFQERSLSKEKVFWGYIETTDLETIWFCLTPSSLVAALMDFLKACPQPIVGIYALTLALCKRAYDQLASQVSHCAGWNIIFINMENALPLLILMQGYSPVQIKPIHDDQLIEKEINSFFKQAQDQTSVTPSFMVYGSSPQLSEGLPWLAYMAFPSQMSPFDAVQSFKPMHTPFEKQRTLWHLRQLSQISSLILMLTLSFFFVGAYFYEMQLQNRQEYFHDKVPLSGQVHLPQGFYAQKAIVMLDDQVQRIPWIDCWQHLGKLMPDLPTLHGLHIQKTSNAVEIHLTMEAREDVQKIQQDLLKELQADTITVTHLPAVMDDQKPYTTNFSQQVPDLLTITINKGLVE